MEKEIGSIVIDDSDRLFETFELFIFSEDDRLEWR